MNVIRHADGVSGDSIAVDASNVMDTDLERCALVLVLSLREYTNLWV